MTENDFLPLILLFLFGGFAIVSALLKFRGGVTALSGVVLAVLEGLSGMALMGTAVPGTGSLETASRVGILTAVLVGVSSTVHLMKVRARTRAREASEGSRLYAAIQYGIAAEGGNVEGALDVGDDSAEAGGRPRDVGGRPRDAGGRPRDVGGRPRDVGDDSADTGDDNGEPRDKTS